MDLSKVIKTLVCLFENIYIRFGLKPFRQNVWELLVPPLLLICFYFAMRDFIRSFAKEKRML